MTAKVGSVRLLFCCDCATVDRVSDVICLPERADSLAALVQRHRFPNRVPHRGIVGKCDNNETAIRAAIGALANIQGIDQLPPVGPGRMAED